MFIYYQTTHKLFHNNELISVDGYSGHGEGRNTNTAQHIPFIGPLPVGLYIIGKAYDHPKLGPITMDLIPNEFNEMFGRTSFRIHPDSIEHPGEASEGCMCQNKNTRIKLRDSYDKQLVVVP